MEINQNNQMTIYTFRYWCQRILPAVYDDSLTYYELLCRVVAKLNEVIELVQGTPDVIEELKNAIEAIEKELEDFKEHGFDDYYKEQVDKWIDDNFEYIFTKIIRQVFFGLTLEGYFVAYIPESWNDIVFDTGMVYGNEDYGRLILKWDADSPYTVEQP